MARLIQMQLEEEWAQAMDCLCLLHYAHYDGCHRSIWFEVSLCNRGHLLSLVISICTYVHMYIYIHIYTITYFFTGMTWVTTVVINPILHLVDVATLSENARWSSLVHERPTKKWRLLRRNSFEVENAAQGQRHIIK